MNRNERELVDELIEEVVGAAREVAGALGEGYQEQQYESAMARELTLRGRSARRKVPSWVMYKGQAIAEYCADLVVDGRIAVELKCAEQFSDQDVADCLRYLKASAVHAALLINFAHSHVQCKPILNPAAFSQPGATD